MKLKALLYISIAGVFGLVVSWKQPVPRMFLIGDSISMYYEPYLKEYLRGTVELESRRDTEAAERDLDVPRGRNGGDSEKVLGFLKGVLGTPAFQPDYLLLNCGLHDIKRFPTEDYRYQVDSISYRANLEEIYRLLRKHDIQLIWVRSTPVIDSVHNPRSKAFKRFASDLKKYNAIADEVFQKYNVPVIDLFSFSESLGREAITDHVHYSAPASRKQAVYIGDQIKDILLP